MIALVDARVYTRRDTLLLGVAECHLRDAIRAAEPSRVVWIANEATPITPPEGSGMLDAALPSGHEWSNILDIFLDGHTVHEDVLCLAPLAGPLRASTVAEAIALRAATDETAVIARVRRLPSREHPVFLQPMPLAAMDCGKLVTHARLKPWPQVITAGGLDGELTSLLSLDAFMDGAGSQHMPRLPYSDGSLELIPHELMAKRGYRDPVRRRFVEIGPHEGAGLEALLYETG